MKENPNSWFIMGAQLDEKGGGREINVNQMVKLNEIEPYWVHLDASRPETKDWLEKNANLDSLIIEALMDEETRPRVNELDGDGAVIFMRGVNLNLQEDPEDMVSIRVYVDKRRIITLRRRKLNFITQIAQRLEQGRGPKNTGEMLALISDRACHFIEPSINEINEETDSLEENVLKAVDKKSRQDVVELRSKAIIFRKYLMPQRDLFSRLKSCEQRWLHSQDRRVLQECYDRISRFVEDLDAVRERTQVIQEEIIIAQNDKLSSRMYILAILSGVFLPLTFLTGLFGINVGGIPGAEHPNAFWFFSGAMLLVSLVQFIIFRSRNWL